MERFKKPMLVAICLLAAAFTVAAQVAAVGSLVGTVTDPTGAVVAGASVTVRDEATGRTFTTQSGPDGGFFLGNLSPGSYTVTVTLQGFKTAEVRAVKIEIGRQRGLTVPLELGEVASTVVIEGGAEVLETTSTTVGTTITGKAITQLPMTSRDAIDLAILMPGAATTGRPRSTSFMGLPKGAINITLDGINAQDNVLKSSDGFFTLIRPRIDSIEEFSISTAGQGAEEAGEGAVQIRMETKRGGNEFRGGAWWYHRNDKFNSNYYFNNQAGTEKQKQRLNQFGINVGGPIVPEKLFFFTALDFYRNPESRTRSRSILTNEATSGIFRWGVSAVPAGPFPANVNCGPTGGLTGGPSCTYNLLAAATAAGHTGTADPTIGALVAAMNSSVNVAGVGLLPQTNPFTRIITFNNGGGGRRNFPDFRFDYNISKNHSWTAIYHYNYFTSSPDFLNSFDATFPVAPFNTNAGSQISNRNQIVSAWRWNIGANKSNEIRAGLVSSPVVFFPDLNFSLYPPIQTNLGGLNARIALPGIVSQPLLTWNAQGRNGGIFQLIESFSWSKGRHNLSMGGNWTEVRVVNFFDFPKVGTVSFGVNSNDPVETIFANANFPGFPAGTAGDNARAAQQGNARALYALLVGRVTGFSASLELDQATRQFATGLQRNFSKRQTEIAMYIQDNFRFRSNLTVNAGVRWDYQAATRDKLNMLFRNRGTPDEALGGVSGSLANLFNPGAGIVSTVPGFELNGTDPWFGRDLNNFAPNLGISWQPNFDSGLLRTIFGGPGKTVVRSSYAISFTREGTNNWESMAQSNPGFASSLLSNVNTHFTAGSINLRDGIITGAVATPPAFVESFNMDPRIGHGVNVFNPDINIPYVQSWNFGIQREITPSTVVEVRYVGNHGTGLWRQNNYNEVNIFENGFLQEFLNAKSNLAIFRTVNPMCGTAGNPACSFANNNLAGQVPLPIMESMFRPGPGGNFTSQFTTAARISQLDTNQAGGFANVLFSNFVLWQNMSVPSPITNCNGPGLPDCFTTFSGAFNPNLFVVNPHARGGGAWLFTNDSHSTYNGLQIELRRRMASGLYFNTNYSFAKGLTDAYADSSASAAGVTTLRNKGYDKGLGAFDIRHAWKFQGIYELPFGKGKRWSAGNSVINNIIGGWELSSLTRWQSGRNFLVTGGTATMTQNESGVELIGITTKQIQNSLGIRKLPDGRVFFFPESLIGPTGTANFDVIRPCQTAGALCQRLFLQGPSFFKADINIVKRTWLNEKVNIEYRAEFLNAFNNINFFYPGNANVAVTTTGVTATSFGRVTNAYQDISTTDDPGGRIIQMVLRINF